MAAAMEAAGRTDATDLVIVTKTFSVEAIRRVHDLGFRVFGENRVQELLEKMDGLPGDIEWHLIGHLQTNKVKKVVGKVALIQSLDRRELLEELERQAQIRRIAEVPCLIQVNISGEAAQFGAKPGDVEALAASIEVGSAVKIRGLMTIGPHTDDKEAIRKAFGAMASLRSELRVSLPQHNWDILSMGMTSDFEEAIAAGATMIRVGSAIMGKRDVQ